MFQFIRKHQAIGLIFIGIVIVSFVIFFSPNQSGGRDPIARGALGSIGGKPIERDEFVAAAKEARLAYMLREGAWPGQGGRNWDQEREAVNRLFLKDEATRLGIIVSDETAAARIVDLPFLRDDKTSAFNRLGYDQFLALIQREGGMTRGEFEQFIRHEIALQHLVQLGGLSGSLVPPREAEARFRSGNDQFAAQLVVFSASNQLAKVNLDPSNVAQYYSNHLAEYRIPERVVVRYVKFALTNYYEKVDEAFAANSNLLASIDAAYAQRGADSFRDAQGQPLPEEAAKAQLKDQVRRGRAQEEARVKANEFANRLYQLDAKPESLEQLAAETGLTVQTSAPFDQSRPPLDMRLPSTFNRAAFALSAEEPFATPVAGEDGLYVYAFERRVPSEVPPLEPVRERVIMSLRRSESRSLAEQAGREFATAAAVAVEAGKTFELASTESGFSVITLTNFSRATPNLPELANRLSVAQLLRTAAEVPVGKVGPFEPAADGGYVLFVQSRDSVPEETVKQELPAFLTQARQFGRFDAFAEWERKRFVAADVKLPGSGRPADTNAPVGLN